MRIWHYELISVLPNKMLVSQWRECIAIKRQWEKGTLKHRLVSYVIDNYKELFINYVTDIIQEMSKRNIKYQDKYYFEILHFCQSNDEETCMQYYPEHNDRYLKQCYYNLQEKADRGIITEEEWQKIESKFKEED